MKEFFEVLGWPGTIILLLVARLMLMLLVAGHNSGLARDTYWLHYGSSLDRTTIKKEVRPRASDFFKPCKWTYRSFARNPEMYDLCIKIQEQSAKEQLKRLKSYTN